MILNIGAGGAVSAALDSEQLEQIGIWVEDGSVCLHVVYIMYEFKWDSIIRIFSFLQCCLTKPKHASGKQYIVS